MKPFRAVLVLIVLTATSPMSGFGQTSPSCSTDRAHEFDFWLGEWEVTANGQVAGHNRIERILDGCVIQESWSGAQGSAGSSFNFFNPQLEKWQQFWVWRNGTTLYLTGDFEDGKIILEGESANRDGSTSHNRVTWFDNEDGTVRQLWETSADGGGSWATAFDGLYRPVAKDTGGD